MNKVSGLKIGENAPEFTAVDIYEKSMYYRMRY